MLTHALAHPPCSAAAGDDQAGDFDPAFVAGFGQANVGDTSPNILGAFCQDTGARRLQKALKTSEPRMLVALGFRVFCFGQANVGDTSPNVLGALCQDDGAPRVHSTSLSSGP